MKKNNVAYTIILSFFLSSCGDGGNKSSTNQSTDGGIQIVENESSSSNVSDSSEENTETTSINNNNSQTQDTNTSQVQNTNESSTNTTNNQQNGNSQTTVNNNNTNSNQNTVVVTEPEYTLLKNRAQLGYLADSTVEIKTIDESQLLYSTKTDSAGNYVIEKELLQEAVNNMSSMPECLLVEVYGGNDIDPDDDGQIVEDEKIPLLGKAKGVYKTTDLLNNDGLSTNLLTTGIVDIYLKSNRCIDDDLMQVVDNDLGLTDIDQDGKITINDITTYDMVAHASPTESYLRRRYLEHIHSNNTEASEHFIESYKQDNDSIQVVAGEEDGNFYVQFYPSEESNRVLFGINVGFEAQLTENIFEQKNYLNIGDVVSLKECKFQDISVCYKRQIVYYDGSKIYPYIPLQKNSEDPEQLSQLETEKTALTEKVKSTDEDLESIKNKIKDIEEALELVQ